MNNEVNELLSKDKIIHCFISENISSEVKFQFVQHLKTTSRISKKYSKSDHSKGEKIFDKPYHSQIWGKKKKKKMILICAKQ